MTDKRQHGHAARHRYKVRADEETEGDGDTTSWMSGGAGERGNLDNDRLDRGRGAGGLFFVMAPQKQAAGVPWAGLCCG